MASFSAMADCMSSQHRTLMCAMVLMGPQRRGRSKPCGQLYQVTEARSVVGTAMLTVIVYKEIKKRGLYYADTRGSRNMW